MVASGLKTFIAVFLALCFLTLFALAIHFFLKLERQYAKRKIIKKSSATKKSKKTINKDASETISSQGSGPNSEETDQSDKKPENTLTKTQDEEEFKTIIVNDLKMNKKTGNKTNKSDDADTNETKNQEAKDLRLSSKGENLGKRRAYSNSIDYTQPAKFPKSLLYPNQAGRSTNFDPVSGNSSKKKEPTKSLKNSKRLKRTGTEEILLNDDLPSIINKDL